MLSARQLAQWEAYLSVEPLPIERIEYQIAYIAVQFAALIGAKKNKSPFTLSDFLLRYGLTDEERKSEVDRDLSSRLRAAFMQIADTEQKP